MCVKGCVKMKLQSSANNYKKEPDFDYMINLNTFSSEYFNFFRNLH
jgi:hypothetical protein